MAACFQKCFTFMDRGFVFRLVNMYLENFNPADGKVCKIFLCRNSVLRTVCNLFLFGSFYSVCCYLFSV